MYNNKKMSDNKRLKLPKEVPILVPGRGGVEGGAPLGENLCVPREDDPGQEPHQGHVLDDQEHLPRGTRLQASLMKFIQHFILNKFYCIGTVKNH